MWDAAEIKPRIASIEPQTIINIVDPSSENPSFHKMMPQETLRQCFFIVSINPFFDHGPASSPQSFCGFSGQSADPAHSVSAPYRHE